MMDAYVKTLKSEWKTVAFWRDVASEFIATFFLVSVQAALPLSWGKGFGQPIQVGLSMGFIVCTMAWSLGDFGGGHMNPAVSLAMTLGLKITFVRGLVYMVFQSAGGIAGAAFVYAVTPSAYRETLATTQLGPDVTPVQGMFIEMWITSILVITILGATNSKRKENVYMATIPIGFAVALGIMTGFGSTGGSLNPARSLGPAVMSGIWKDHWVYWAGPCLGGVFAILIYTLFDKAECITAHFNKDKNKDEDGKYVVNGGVSEDRL